MATGVGNDDTGFPKDGRASPGVARQYSGTLGKVGNCQIGVSLHAASDTASCPLSRRLFLPAAWDGPDAEAAGGTFRIWRKGQTFSTAVVTRVVLRTRR